jgi:hypothetical protein
MACSTLYLQGIGWGLLGIAAVAVTLALLVLLLEQATPYWRRFEASPRVQTVTAPLEAVAPYATMLIFLILCFGPAFIIGIQRVADTRNAQSYGPECQERCEEKGYEGHALTGITEVVCTCVAAPNPATSWTIAKGVCLP